MNPEGHEEIYRVAYQSAAAELIDINTDFARLRARQDHVEKLIVALRPLVEELEDEEQPEAANLPEEQELEQEEVSAAEDATEENEPMPAFNADPFQRRIDHVLGIGAGIRDVRKYSRQF